MGLGSEASRTDVAALDAKGRPLPGWPVRIAGGWPRAAAFGTDGTLYLSLQGDDDADAWPRCRPTACAPPAGWSASSPVT